MGFKVTDVVPLSSKLPSPTMAPARGVLCKLVQVLRTDTTSTLRAKLPASATIIGFTVFSTAASNAGTTATINIGNASSATFYLNGVDVKTSAGLITPSASQVANLFNFEQVGADAGARQDLPIYVQYAETGTASSSGGPFYVLISFVP